MSLDSHMNFRMSSRDKKIIETAAKLKGLKSQTYVRQKLIESAEKDIAAMNQINALILSEQDWQQFIYIMDAPIRINENLRNAIEHFDDLDIQ